jgi:hypothetical protein
MQDMNLLARPVEYSHRCWGVVLVGGSLVAAGKSLRRADIRVNIHHGQVLHLCQKDLGVVSER